jgi:hypothetical protein
MIRSACAGGSAAARRLRLAARSAGPQEAGQQCAREVIDKVWQRYVVWKDGRVDIRAFTFCVLSHLQTAIHRRDVFTRPSWRYADPRANLLSDAKWEATRPHARTATRSAPDSRQFSGGVGQTCREVARRLPDNPDVRFEKVKGKEELILTSLDALDEPPALIRLRKVVTDRPPRVELAELVLEVALRTGFTEAFTHLTDRSARTADFVVFIFAPSLVQQRELKRTDSGDSWMIDG